MSQVENGDSKSAAYKDSGCFGTRHVQALLMFLGMSIAYGQRVSLSVAVVAMKNSSAERHDFPTFDWDDPTKSYVLSSFFWGYIVTQVPAGYIASVWSAQRLLSICIMICGLLNLLLPIVAVQGDWIAICMSRVGMGLCQGSLLPCVQTLLSKWAPPNERAKLGTFAYAGAQFGTVITMPISGLLAGSDGGWPSIFYLIGALSIAWAIAFYIYGSDSPEEHSQISFEERKYIQSSFGKFQSSNEQKQKLKIPWKHIFTSVPMWAIIIAHCGQNWGYWMLLTEIPSYLNGVLKFDIQKNGALSALPYLAMWILSFPLSYTADYVLKKGVSREMTRKVCNTIAHWGPAAMLCILAAIPIDNTVAPMALLTVAVALNAGSLCGFQVNHIDLSPNFAGTMMSITNCISNIVSLLAPIIFSLIVTDTTNVSQWQIVFYLSALIYFVGNFFFIVFGKADVQRWNNNP